MHLHHHLFIHITVIDLSCHQKQKLCLFSIEQDLQWKKAIKLRPSQAMIIISKYKKNSTTKLLINPSNENCNLVTRKVTRDIITRLMLKHTDIGNIIVSSRRHRLNIIAIIIPAKLIRQVIQIFKLIIMQITRKLIRIKLILTTTRSRIKTIKNIELNNIKN